MAELSDNQPSESEYLQQVTLVKLMQIYDVLMMQLHTSRPDLVEKIEKLHEAGELIYPEIIIGSAEVTDE